MRAPPGPIRVRAPPGPIRVCGLRPGPEQPGRDPDHREEAGQQVARVRGVGRRDRGEQSEADAALFGEQGGHGDRPHDETGDDPDAGDQQVVVDLALRVLVRGAVHLQHHQTVERVAQGHGRGEQDRQAQQRDRRRPGQGGAGGQDHQPDLAAGVETEGEQEPDRVHVPGVPDPPQRRRHDPGGGAAWGEGGRVDDEVRVRGEGPLEAQRLAEGGQVRDGDQDQVETGDAQPDDAERARDSGVLVQRGPDDPGSGDHQDPAEDDHGGVTRRERQTDRGGIAALGDELPGRVVDHRDVVEVVGVHQTTEVGDGGDADRHRPGRARDHPDTEQTQPEHVQGDDHREGRTDPEAEGAGGSPVGGEQRAPAGGGAGWPWRRGRGSLAHGCRRSAGMHMLGPYGLSVSE